MKSYILHRAKSFANFLQNESVVNLIGYELDPIQALYDYPKSEPVISFPVEAVRSFWAAGLMGEVGKGNPFVETAVELLLDPSLVYENSSLSHYYSSFTPKSVVDLLGVPASTLEEGYSKLPADSTVMPWWPSRGKTQPSRFAEEQQKASALEYRKHGGRGTVKGNGLSLFGPTSESKGRVELERLRRLVRDIGTRGYSRSAGRDGDITGHLLVSAVGKTAVSLFGGLHRAAVLAALGEPTIPVRLNFTIISRANYESDLPKWPHVANGLYSKEGASNIFRSYFAGRAYAPDQGLDFGGPNHQFTGEK